MDSEECEISWIIQSELYGDLLKALPNLRSLTIKGIGTSLGNTQNNPDDALEHSALEKLEIICGGLPNNVVKELQKAKFPKLKALVLYLGVEEYGYSCELEDLAELAKKEKFPNLKTLGFTNSEEQDDIVEILLDSDMLPQLEVLDISCGCLTDRGGQMILDAKDKLTGLKKLNAAFHYMSPDMMKKLKALPFDVNVSDPQEADEDDDDIWMYPMYTE
jgi:hypothetical protein